MTPRTQKTFISLYKRRLWRCLWLLPVLLLSACAGGSGNSASNNDGISLVPLKDNLPPLITNDQYDEFYGKEADPSPSKDLPIMMGNTPPGSNPNPNWDPEVVKNLLQAPIPASLFTRTANPQPFSLYVSDTNTRTANRETGYDVTIYIPTGPLPNHYQTQNLQKLVSNQAGIIVIDQVMTGLSTLDAFHNPRVSEYYLRNNGGRWQKPPLNQAPYQHGDKVLYTIMGNDSLATHPGMFGQKGRVLFVSPTRYLLKQNSAYSTMFTDPSSFRYLYNRVMAGYSVINTSWGTVIDPPGGKNYTINKVVHDLNESRPYVHTVPYETYLKTYPNLLAMAHVIAPFIDNDMDELVSNGALDQLNKLAKAGANWVVSAGNYSDKSGILYLLMLHADQYIPEDVPQRHWKDLEDSYIIASSFHSQDNYTNTCIIDPYHCLVAWDIVRVPLDMKRPITQPWRSAYGPGREEASRGTSFAAPYISSVVGLVKSIFPFFSASNAQVTVLTTAYQISPGPRVNARTGWGLIQPQGAIKGPAMFYDRDFVADLSNNLNLQTRQHYIFSNPISGAFGLTVKGNSRNAVLELSADNSYKGDTILANNAILDMSGILRHSTVYVESGSRLKGNGQVYAIENEGIVQSGSDSQNQSKPKQTWAITSTKNTDLIASPGLLVAQNYRQRSYGSLWVPLGVPLVVKGTVNLQGTLTVTGLQKALISQDGQNAYGIAIVSKGDLINRLDKMNSSSPLISTDLTNANVLALPNKDNALMVKVKLQTATRAVSDGVLRGANPEQTRALKVGAQNLDSLFMETLQSHSPLAELVQELRLNTDKDTLKKNLQTLSGGEFVRTMQNNNRIDSLLISNGQFELINPKRPMDRFYASANQIWDLGKTRTTLLSVGYRFLSHGYYGMVGLDHAYSVFNNNATTQTDTHTQSIGLQLGAHKDYPSISLNLQAQLRVYFNTVDRQVTLGKEHFSFNDQYSQTDMALRFSLSKTTSIIERQLLTPYVGFSLLKQNTGAFSETYKDLLFHSSGQTLSIFHLFAGFSYNWIEPFKLQGLNVHLDYYIQDQINSLPSLRGILRDQNTRRAIQFDTTSPLVLQTWRLRLNYHYDRWKVGANFQTIHQDKWYFSLGGQLSYDF